MAQKVIVIGGGAAGILAAWRAAQMGAEVTLLEKNPRLGMKILISGGGKCNLTHAGDMEDIRAQFRPEEGRFLKPSFYKFTNEHFLELIKSQGMATYARPDGRIFPVEPRNAKDVVGLLTRLLETAGVRICCGASVTALTAENGKLTAIQTGETWIPTSTAIVAVGGSSYPATGTTGDGWRWVGGLGHRVKPLIAALAPIYMEDCDPALSGIALRDIVLSARPAVDAKPIVHWKGDLLFTHKGISGPAALGISREVAESLQLTPPVLDIDLAPGTDYEQLRDKARQAILTNPRVTPAHLAEPYLPSRLVPGFLAAVGIDTGMRGAHLPSKSLNRLITTLKRWPIGRVRAVPLERGEVVAGGVALDEVDPRTMDSRIVDGLFLCGEVLNIAGPVGGYNLQAAWSTGWVAGESAATSA